MKLSQPVQTTGHLSGYYGYIVDIEADGLVTIVLTDGATFVSFSPDYLILWEG